LVLTLVLMFLAIFRRSETPLNLCQQPVGQLPWRAVCQQFGEVLLPLYGHRSGPRGFREQRYRLAVYHEHPTLAVLDFTPGVIASLPWRAPPF